MNSYLNLKKPIPSLTLRIKTIIFLVGACSGTSLLADDSMILDYPDSGVELGQGWNSYNISKTTGRCIIFQQAKAQAGQEKTMKLISVSTRYQLDRELDISASASYKGVTGSISGKVDYANNVSLASSATNIVALAYVDNGNILVSPPLAEDQKKVANLLAEGRSPTEVNSALGAKDTDLGARMLKILPEITSNKVSERHRAFDIKKINAAVNSGSFGNGAGSIRLSENYRKMAVNEPEKFRKVCGDSYVASISQGGEIAAVLTFETNSISQQKQIATNISGAGWGATAEVSMKERIKKQSKGTKTSISYFQRGGSGDPLPTDIDLLYDSIQKLPNNVSKAPYSYKLELGRYEELENWPESTTVDRASYTAIDEIVYRASVWRTLNESLRGILDATNEPFGSDGYLLGRGASREKILSLQDIAQNNYEKVNRAIRECLKTANSATRCNPSPELGAVNSSISVLTEQEMNIRSQLPLPIDKIPNPSERLAGADAIREKIYQLWIHRVNAARCERQYGAAVCLTVRDVEAYKKNIVVHQLPRFVIAANKLNRACMSPNTKTGLVNLTEGCNFTNSNLLFYWDAGKKHLVHSDTKKCVNVRGNKTNDGADIILYKCQSSKEENDQWKMEKQGQLIQFKNVNSEKCITVTGELRSGRRLTQSDCTKKPAKGLHWRLLMQ